MRGWWMFARCAWQLGWRPVGLRLSPFRMEWVMPDGFTVFVTVKR